VRSALTRESREAFTCAEAPRLPVISGEPA